MLHKSKLKTLKIEEIPIYPFGFGQTNLNNFILYKLYHMKFKCVFLSSIQTGSPYTLYNELYIRCSTLRRFSGNILGRIKHGRR